MNSMQKHWLSQDEYNENGPNRVNELDWKSFDDNHQTKFGTADDNEMFGSVCGLVFQPSADRSRHPRRSDDNHCHQQSAYRVSR